MFINKITDNNKYLTIYKNNYILRYKISICISLLINIIYVIFKLITGIYYKSLWIISFSIYYIILIILRVNILTTEKYKYSQYKTYKNIGIIILFINLFLTINVLIIVNGNHFKKYNEIIAIAVACYTFYSLFNSIITLIKYKKYNNILINASKIINVITSLVSFISLEIIMLSTFGNDLEFNRIIIMCTGGIIAIIITIISLCIIIKANENIEKI